MEYEAAAEVDCDKFVYEAVDAVTGQPVAFVALTKISEPHTLKFDVVTADGAHVGFHQVTIIGRLLQNPVLSTSQTIVVEIQACTPNGLQQGVISPSIDYFVGDQTLAVDLKDMFAVKPASCPWELDFTFSPSLTSPDPFTLDQEVGKLFVFTTDESRVNTYSFDVKASLRGVAGVEFTVSITVNVISGCQKVEFEATSVIRSLVANVQGAAQTMSVDFDDPMPSCGTRQVDLTYNYVPLTHSGGPTTPITFTLQTDDAAFMRTKVLVDMEVYYDAVSPRKSTFF